MKKEKLIIFDTTLRDGEQAPGATMTIDEKLLIAKNLEEMKVDVIEAGFPASSIGDFNSVKKIAETIENATICGLARAKEDDIRKTALALEKAKSPRIHTFIATSDIHLEFKLKMSREKVLELIKSSVGLARSLVPQVDWSPEDATRSDHDFLFKAIEVAITAGANTINIPDTVGYTTPEEYYHLISAIKNNVSNIDKAIISTHCHNDLGLATANSLSAVLAGARQVECTINGIGERAGNAALEEIVMAIKTRPDFYKIATNIETTMISRVSKLVSTITGFVVQRNKAIVGANAFAHESGIHQDGMLKNRATYEIMSPQSIGLQKNSLTLGKLSGRSAVKEHLKEMGYEIDDKKFEDFFVKFKDLADRKKEIHNEDLIKLLDIISTGQSNLELIDLKVNSNSAHNATAIIKINYNQKILETDFTSQFGSVDAIFNAIKKIIPHNAKLDLYQVDAVTQTIDSQANVMVRLESAGRIYSANGSDTDVLVASALAYINCLAKMKS